MKKANYNISVWSFERFKCRNEKAIFMPLEIGKETFNVRYKNFVAKIILTL